MNGIRFTTIYTFTSSMEKRDLKDYILAFSVLAVVAVVFIVILISIPYLFYLIFKIFFLTIQFGIVFIIVFWLVIVLLAWTIKIISISKR
ncbi:hypothetical protein [Persephonella sp.]